MPTPSGRPSMMDAILAGEQVKITVGNREACFSDPVKSIIDGSHHANRQQYDNHLKQHGCVEMGNDSSIKTAQKREVQGDFNVRSELKEAVQEVMSKQ